MMKDFRLGAYGRGPKLGLEEVAFSQTSIRRNIRMKNSYGHWNCRNLLESHYEV